MYNLGNMKRLLPFFLTLAFLLIVAVLGWKYIKYKTTPTNNTQNGMQQENNTNTVLFTLFKESGEVLYKKVTEANYVPLETDEIDLPSGSAVKTIEGQAHVLFPDNSLMSIDSQTELTINVDTSGVSINQILGNTWHRVQKLLSGKNYQVETPTAIASVRGTVFAIDVLKKYTEDQTDAYVTEGSVNLDQVIKKDSKKEVKFSKLITAGKLLKVKKFIENQKPELEDISDEKKNSKFFIKNAYVEKLRDRNDVQETIRQIREGIRKEVNKSTSDTETSDLIQIFNSFPQLTGMIDKIQSGNLSEEELRKIGTNACQIINDPSFKSKIEYLKILGNEQYQKLMIEYNRAITECQRL